MANQCSPKYSLAEYAGTGWTMTMGTICTKSNISHLEVHPHHPKKISNKKYPNRKTKTIHHPIKINIFLVTNVSQLEAHPRQLNHNWHFMGSLQIFQTPIKPHTTYYYRQFHPKRGTLCTKRRKLLQWMHVLAKRVALYWPETWATLIVYFVSLFSCLLDRQNGDFSSGTDPSLGWWIMWE